MSARCPHCGAATEGVCGECSLYKEEDSTGYFSSDDDAMGVQGRPVRVMRKHQMFGRHSGKKD